MAIGESDFDDTFRPRFWDDPIYFHRERFEPFCFRTYWYWDYLLLTRTTISGVDVKEMVKPWISNMETAVNACNRTLHDDMVQLNELRRSERQFSKYSDLLKRHAVGCDDDLLDIVHALRNLKRDWDKLYDKLENPVLKYYMLKNVLMSDIEHCFFLSWASHQLNMMHRLKDKIKVFTSLHEEILKQSDSLHRCFLRQGMQAVRDELDYLQLLNKGILSEPTKEMIKMTESSLNLNHWVAVFDFLEEKQRQNQLKCSTLRGMVTREVVLTSMGFLDLCLSVKGHLAICIEVGTKPETLSTTSICRTEPVFCLVAENSSTETRFWNFQLPSKIKERGLCFAGRFHLLKYEKALTSVLVVLVWCILCAPSCSAMDVDAKADHLSQLFFLDGIKDMYLKDGRQLVILQQKPSHKDFYKQWTTICYVICLHTYQNIVDSHKSVVVSLKENKTHTFEEDCDFGEQWTGICCYICRHKHQSSVYDFKENKTHTFEEDCDFGKQSTGICCYICRHKHQSSVYAFKENKTHTFEEDCDFDIYFLHIEQKSGMRSWLDGKIYVWICTNKCSKMFSSAQGLLQGFQHVVDEILKEYSKNQPKILLEMTNRTVKVISLKPNNDERTMNTEEGMKMPESIDDFNTILILWLAIIAISGIELIFICAWISIKHVKLKSPNPVTWKRCKKYSPTTYDLPWFRGNSKRSQDHWCKSFDVKKEVACLRKPVQEQTKTPETKPTVSIDTVCSETSEKFHSLTEKYVASLLSVDMSLEESNEFLITTQSIEADQNFEFVYDEHCEIEIRNCTENKGIRNELHTQDKQTRNFHANKELEKSKSIPEVVDACNDLSSARNSGDESFYDLKWKSKLQLKVHPDLPSEKSIYLPNTVIKEDAVSPTAQFVKNVDFDKPSAKKENPGRRRKGVDSTFSEKEFDHIRLLRDLTWLPLNQLPVPKIEITVGFVPDFPPLMAIIDQIAIGKPPAPHVSMRYELLRFCTLRSYPRDDKPYLIKLAEAGFYYASDGDGVVCYCCGIRRYNWTADDNPLKIHKRINPTCKYLTKNEEVNVRNEFNGPFSKSLLYIDNILEPRESQEPSEDINNDWAPERTRSPAPRPQSSQNAKSSSQLGINTAIPKHSQYATKPARVASFNGWPDSASHSPDELADAGFFYAGFGDCVRCFYCGIGLRHWTQDDNPWIEHARWAKNCVFVKQKKGDEFVNLVQLAVQYSQDNASQENATANQLSPREIENYLLSDASQSVLEMGYQPRIIKKAIENILRQNRQTEIAAQFLMEQVLALEEAGNSTQAASTPGSPAAPVAHVGPTEGASASAPKESANEKCNDKESVNATQKPIADEKKKEEKKTSKKTNDKAKETGSNESIAQDPKAIKAENEQLKEQTLCKICLDQTVCIVFLPCGHLVTCADCAPAMRKCPICRALVKGTVRTYMS